MFVQNLLNKRFGKLVPGKIFSVDAKSFYKYAMEASNRGYNRTLNRKDMEELLGGLFDTLKESPNRKLYSSHHDWTSLNIVMTYLQEHCHKNGEACEPHLRVKVYAPKHPDCILDLPKEILTVKSCELG